MGTRCPEARGVAFFICDGAMERRVSTGHPELVAAIASEIADSGPIPFVRFMELALYHPQFGYYMRAPESGQERIGWQGDFYTSSDVHPILGKALAKQAEQMHRLLGQPDPFTVIEMGPGKGLLARHFLSACERHFSLFFPRLRYVLIDRSPAMREIQRRNLAPWLDRPNVVTWVENLGQLAPQRVTGLFLSNELVDSFPVHRVHVTATGIRELGVDYRDGRFVECLLPLSSAKLAPYVRPLSAEWPEGYRTEINLQASDWITQIAGCVDRGFVITIDYGHTAQDLYRPDRKDGARARPSLPPDAVGCRARCPDDGADVPIRHDLRTERERPQPQRRGIHRAGTSRRRGERADARRHAARGVVSAARQGR